MMKSIEIEGFRSIKSLRFDLHALNVLIGPNQSGKTNLLDALDLLANAVQGRLGTSIYQARGGLATILWAGEGQRRIRYKVEFGPEEPFTEEKGAAYELVIEERGASYEVAEETVATGQGWDDKRPFYPLWMNGGIGTIHNLFSNKQENYELPPDKRREPAIAQIRDARAYPTLGKIRDVLSAIAVYPGFATQPRWTCGNPNETPQIRQPQFIEYATSLSNAGDNLVNVLYSLSQDKEIWAEFLEHLKVGFPDLEDIVFPPDAGQGRISLAWIDRRFRGRKFPAEVLSAGTLSFLAYAALFASPEPLGLIGLDEPEIHLHPELLYRLIGLMEKAATRRQIIVATHSDAMLSFLSDPTDLILVRNDGEGTTLIRPHEPDLREWLKDYTLGELRESGHLEAFAEYKP